MKKNYNYIVVNVTERNFTSDSSAFNKVFLIIILIVLPGLTSRVRAPKMLHCTAFGRKRRMKIENIG